MDSEKSELIKFLIDSGTLTFGSFLTKSGRTTPYYFNFGNINNGSNLNKLGMFYAKHIHKIFNSNQINSIFGPAYKGIPIATCTTLQYFNLFNIDIPFTSNRKEAKVRGEGGNLFGYQLKEADSVIIVEDVLTSGSTFREILPMLSKIDKINILGIVIAVDREEKGNMEVTALEEVESQFNIKVHPMLNISEVMEFVKTTEEKKYQIPENFYESFIEYQTKYLGK